MNGTHVRPRQALDWRVGGVAGGLLGALVYALAYPWISLWLVGPLDYGKPTLSTLTGLAPGVMGIVFGIIMVGVAFALPKHPGHSTQLSPAPSHGRLG